MYNVFILDDLTVEDGEECVDEVVPSCETTNDDLKDSKYQNQ